MQISGTEYLKSLRDKRVVYLGGERIEDVTSSSRFSQRRALIRNDV